LRDNPAGDPLEQDLETELKLAFRPDDLDKLKSVVKRFGGAPKIRKLSATYFDTPDAALRNEGLALRVRRDGRNYIQTLKGKNEGSAGGAMKRREIEGQVRSSRPDLDAITDSEFAETVHRISKTGLKPVFNVEVERTTLNPTNDESIVVDIDVGEVRAGRRRKAICEVELESKGASLRALYDLALELHREVPLRVSKVSKSDTGYRLRAGAQPASFKGVKPSLDPDVSVEDALSVIVQSCLDQLLANEPCVTDTKDPEGVHQMRVSLRRMRSAIRVFKPMIPPDQYAHLVTELKWLTGSLGPARDWDVYEAEIVDPVTVWLPDSEALGMLRRRIKPRRARAWREAREAVSSPRFTELVLYIGSWLAEKAWRRQQLSGDTIELFGPARAFAAGVLSHRYKAVRKLGRRIEELSVAESHELRLKVKRLRYATEFFSSLYKPRIVRPFTAAMSALQDDLGYLNDVAVASDLAGQILDHAKGHDREELRIAEGLLVGWHGHAVTAHKEDLVRDVRQFLKSKRFWKNG